MNNSRAILIVLAAVLLGIIMQLEVFTLPIQGRDTWRQSKTAWNIRYFVRHDSNIFNPRQPYLNNENNIVRYEFPLMQWSIAMVEKVTGESIFVMRLIVFLISLLTLFSVFKLSMLFTEDQVTSSIVVWVFMFFPTFFFYSTSMMPDVLALCFGMFYVLYFFRYLKSKNQADLIYSAVFIALAGLSKLPFILLGSFALVRCIDIIASREPARWRQLVSFAIVNALALLPVVVWYAIVVPGWKDNNIAAGFTRAFVGWPLFFEFLKNHIFVNFPIEILSIPSLILLLIGVYYCIKERLLFFVKPVYFYIPLLVLFIFFMYVLNVIREGHAYYLMPFYPVFILPIILCLYKTLKWSNRGRVIIWVLLLAIPLVCWLRIRDDWDVKYAYFNHDFFNCRDQLSTIGTQDDIAIFVNDPSLAIFPYIIDKSGYIFWNDHLPTNWIKDLINRKNAVFLFSDSRIIEAQEDFDECVSKMIMECGTVRVFRLKTKEEIQQIE